MTSKEANGVSTYRALSWACKRRWAHHAHVSTAYVTCKHNRNVMFRSDMDSATIPWCLHLCLLREGFVAYYCLQIILVTDTEVDLEWQHTPVAESSILLTLPLHLSQSVPLHANVLLTDFTVYQFVGTLWAFLQWETTVGFPAWALLHAPWDVLERYRNRSWAAECLLLHMGANGAGRTAFATVPVYCGH